MNPTGHCHEPFTGLDGLFSITGSPSPPLSLQNIIIWAKKYGFYLELQTLRGNKLLKVHMPVLKKKEKCNFYVGFPTFCSSICAGLQVLASARTQPPHEHAAGSSLRAASWSTEPPERRLMPGQVACPPGLPSGGQLIEFWGYKCHLDQARPTLAPNQSF